jgi:hypothetical protein
MRYLKGAIALVICWQFLSGCSDPNKTIPVSMGPAGGVGGSADKAKQEQKAKKDKDVKATDLDVTTLGVYTDSIKPILQNISSQKCVNMGFDAAVTSHKWQWRALADHTPEKEVLANMSDPSGKKPLAMQYFDKIWIDKDVYDGLDPSTQERYILAQLVASVYMDTVLNAPDSSDSSVGNPDAAAGLNDDDQAAPTVDQNGEQETSAASTSSQKPQVLDKNQKTQKKTQLTPKHDLQLADAAASSDDDKPSPLVQKDYAIVFKAVDYLAYQGRFAKITDIRKNLKAMKIIAQDFDCSDKADDSSDSSKSADNSKSDDSGGN